MLGALWNAFLILVGFVFLLKLSVEVGRPLATTAVWLVVIAALLVWGAVSPPPSARALAWGGLVTVASLALVAADLSRAGRAAEIAVWLPAICAGLIGWLYFAIAVHEPRARAARGVLAAVLLAVPFALWATVGDFTPI